MVPSFSGSTGDGTVTPQAPTAAPEGPAHHLAGRLHQVASRYVVILGWALVVTQLVIRGRVISSGFLYSDDFLLQQRAWRLPLLSAEFLLTPHDGHLMPGGLAIGWAVANAAPLSQLPVTASLLALQAVASAGVWLMLGRIFGPRPLVLLPLAVYLFAPLTLPSSAWWTAGLAAMPLQAGMAWAVWSHVGYLRAGGRRRAAATWLVVAATLCFVELAVVLPALLIAVTWVLSPCVGGWRAFVAAITSHWRLWAGLAALVAGYLVLWVRHSGGQPWAPLPAGGLTAWFRRGLVEGLIPAAVGGPVSWEAIGAGAAVAAPPVWLVVLGVIVALAVLGWSWWARPRARRAWVVLALFATADLALSAARWGGTDLGPLALLTLRHSAGLSVVLALALGSAALPPRGEPEPPRVVAARTWLRRRSAATGVVPVLALDVFVLLAMISTAAFGGVWSANPARPWVTNARTSLAAASADEPILPAAVPDDVLSPLTYPANLTSHLLAPVAGDQVFASRSRSLMVFDGSGALVPGRVEGASAMPPLEPGCWRLQDGHGLIRLDEVLRPWDYTVHLGYLAGGSTGGTVTLGAGEPAAIELTRGLHDEYVQVRGGGSVLYLTLADPDVTVCVGSAAVGGAVPASWPAS